MPDYDLIIIGGGIIGGSVLYHLAQLGYPGRVLVLEREDALSKGSTALSAGGFRNIWTTPINMRLTSYSIKKLAAFQDELRFPIGFDQRGYLFCQYEENFESAKAYGAEWAKNGVAIEFLDAAEVEAKVPGLRAGIDHIDPEVNEILQMKPIAGGVFGPECGSFDPSAAAQGYFERGLEGFDGRAELRLNATVKKLRIVDGKYRGVEMADGSFIESEKIVVAAGAWTNQLLEISGLSRRRSAAGDPAQSHALHHQHAADRRLRAHPDDDHRQRHLLPPRGTEPDDRARRSRYAGRFRHDAGRASTTRSRSTTTCRSASRAWSAAA